MVYHRDPIYILYLYDQMWFGYIFKIAAWVPGVAREVMDCMQYIFEQYITYITHFSCMVHNILSLVSMTPDFSTRYPGYLEHQGHFNIQLVSFLTHLEGSRWVRNDTSIA